MSAETITVLLLLCSNRPFDEAYILDIPTPSLSWCLVYCRIVIAVEHGLAGEASLVYLVQASHHYVQALVSVSVARWDTN